MVNLEKERQEAFSLIYKGGGWSRLGSGPGSTPSQAGPFLDKLSSIIKVLNPTSILDVGCGQGLAIGALSGFTGYYTGIDIVPEVIEENRRNFPVANFAFLVFDLAEKRLDGQFDLVIIKDVLQHLPNSTIYCLMSNVAMMCGAAIVVNDSYCGKGINFDEIKDGGYRPLPNADIFSAAFPYREHLGDYSVHAGGPRPDVKSMFLLSTRASINPVA